MKKYSIRIVGAVFILAALALMFLSPWIRFDSTSRKEMRSLNSQISVDLNNIEDTLLEDRDLRADLKDNDLPSSKTQITEQIRELKTFFKELLDSEISLQELMHISQVMPAYISDAQKFLDTDLAAETVFENTEQLDYEDAEDIVDTLNSYRTVFDWLHTLMLCFIVVGIAAAVAHCLNWVRFIKYIFLAMVAALVIALYIAIPIVSDLMRLETTLTGDASNLSMSVTAMPIITLALLLVPIVLDIIFERKHK